MTICEAAHSAGNVIKLYHLGHLPFIKRAERNNCDEFKKALTEELCIPLHGSRELVLSA
jgi:hypothetical protein